MGLSLSWEPFDWGRKKNEIAEKRDAVTQDKNTETSTERKVIMDVDDKYRQILQSWSKLRRNGSRRRRLIENLTRLQESIQSSGRAAEVVLQAQPNSLKPTQTTSTLSRTIGPRKHNSNTPSARINEILTWLLLIAFLLSCNRQKVSLEKAPHPCGLPR